MEDHPSCKLSIRCLNSSSYSCVLITNYLSTIAYGRLIWMISSILTFILFSCPLTLWVLRLILWTDLWSDGLTHPLGNTFWSTGQPRAINAVGARGMFLVVNHSDWSVPLSPVSFLLYICCFSLSFFYFSQQISSQSATVLFIKQSFRQLGAIVLHAFFVAFFTSFNCKYPLPYVEFSLCSIVYLNIYARRLRRPVES